MKKKLMILLVLFFGIYLSGCSLLTMTFDFTTTSTIATTLPSTIDGTISVGDNEYSGFSTFHSATYDITDVDLYNQVLISTRDMIRRSNIYVLTTSYDYVRPNPFSTSTVLQISAQSQGSGVIFMEDENYYYALTNHHVISSIGDEVKFEIKCFGDVTESEAEVVAFDESLDLAVLKFPKADRTDIHIIDYTTRLYTKFNTDELVMAVGNPLSLENNVTFGVFKTMESLNNVTFKAIYHDAPIHEGSSGGALVDIDGNLLGLNTWGSSSSDELSFAIPNYIIYMFLVNYGII